MDNGIYNGTYNYIDGLMGFKKGQYYTFQLIHPKNECYQLQVLNEDLYVTLASEISIKRYFKNIKKED